MDRLVAAQDQQLLGSAMICSVLANINRDKNKKHEPYEPDDFMPHRGKRAEIEVPDGESLYRQTLAMFGTSEKT